ncbi:MAG: GNAT family N-acetyltransferase [Oscillospiraceae bacterium]|nr:GNAT family N-acetyltransferase [Oscillospiraceae bacterium]
MYWTKNWSDEKIQKNIDNSTLCYGAYDEDGVQVGYGRVVTDFSTVAYLLDFVVDEPFRGKGIGTKLMKEILENESLNDCSFVLATSVQAKKFYESLGFQIKNEKYMLCRVS